MPKPFLFTVAAILASSCVQAPREQEHTWPVHEFNMDGEIDLSAVATTGWEGRRIAVQLTVRNLSPETNTIQWGLCAFGVRAYSSHDRTEPISTNEPASPFVCFDVGIAYTLQPGEVTIIDANVGPPPERREVASGRYDVVVVLKTDRGLQEHPAGSVSIH